MSRPILIIGAGLGGLAAALGLLKRGFAVEVYEDAPELGDVGAGISVQQNFRAILNALGIMESLAGVAVTASAAGRRHWQTGEMITLTEYDQADWLTGGRGVWFLHRADLHEAMVEGIRAIAPDCIRLNHHLVSFDQDAGGVEARFANGAVVRGSALIGADGLRSTTRALLFGAESPRFSGVVSWRGLVPMERLRPGVINPDSCRWVAPDWRILCYPVRRRTLMNYVCSVGKQTWQIESWKEHSTVEELLEILKDGDPTIREVVRETPPEACFKWALFDRPVLPQWTVGRVALLGDAAHPMLPFLGQGAGMAMEDGLVLARCFEKYREHGPAFANYVRVRKPRADEVQLISRTNAQWPFDRQMEVPALPDGSPIEQERVRIELYDATTVAI